jgi:hypothetical protein
VGRAVARHRAPAADATTGDVDHERERADRAGGLDGGGDVVVVVDVAPDGDCAVAQLLGQVGPAVGVTVEDRHADAQLGQPAHGRAAQPAGAARHQGRSSGQVHVVPLPSALCS